MAKPNTRSVLASIKALNNRRGISSVTAGAELEKDQLVVMKDGKAYPAKLKTEKSEKTPKPKRGKNGGARPGSGRKPIELDEKRKTFKRSWEDFGNEEIEVSELHSGTKEVRKIKAKRIRIVQERLFAAANKGDVSAIKEFNDRIGGKARQPVVGDQEEDPVQIDLGVDRLLERAYGDEEMED